MSMLRTFQRASTWNRSDYICLCCRRRLLAQRQERRGYSTDATSSEIDDDWHMNFNDLYEEPLAYKSRYGKSEETAEEKAALAAKGKTMRQRMAKGDNANKTDAFHNFSSLKSKLSNQLPKMEEDQSVPDQPNNTSAQNADSASYQPFAEDADTEFLDELRTDIRNDTRKHKPMRLKRARQSEVDVYRGNPLPEPVGPKPTKDDKWEAILRELKEEFALVIIPQMIADAEKKKLEARKAERSTETKFQKIFDSVMQSRDHDDSGPMIRRVSEKATTVSKRKPAAMAQPYAAEGSSEDANAVPESTEEGHPVESTEIQAENPAAENTFPAGAPANASHGRQEQISSSTFRKYGSNAWFSMGRFEHSTPLTISSPRQSEQTVVLNEGFKRSMSSTVRAQTTLMNEVDSEITMQSNKEAAASLWGVATELRAGDDQSPSANARNIFETLHSKSKRAKSPISSKNEGKEKKSSGKKGKHGEHDSGSKKSKRQKSHPESKNNTRSQKTRMRRIRSRLSVRMIASTSKLFKRHIAARSGRVISRGKRAGAIATLERQTSIGRRRNGAEQLTGGFALTHSPDESEKNTESTERSPMPFAFPDTVSADVTSIDPTNLEITPLEIPKPPVPGLQYGLDRVLFNSGVFQLQDPHSRVYNFDPYLQKIMPVVEFDYNALKQYKTSSQDTALSDLAKEHGKRYIGSTSSMTATLGHFHYLLSSFRPLNLKMLSRSFPENAESFTQINRAPNAIFLRRKGDGLYAIDVDKEYDGANVLMMLGKSMEKLLTLPKADYERYRKENSHSVTEEERTAPEAYEYTTMGDFLMRSQLDAYDSRLPGNGMFDLKTRAVVSIRMDAGNYEPMTGYEIKTLQGRFQSYEREYYDMMRSTMLKYMLQVRMGRMDGIFLAYHNVERIFGFQYVPLHEIDRTIHSQTDPCLGDQEFKVSLELLNKALDKATTKFPDQSLRLHFEASEEQIGAGNPTTVMWIYAEPMAEDEIDRIQSTSQAKTAEFEQTMMGIEKNQHEDGTSGTVSATAADAVEPVDESADATVERPQSELAVLPDSDPMFASSTQPNSNESEYSTSSSDAMPNYTAELDQTIEPDLKPLFVASLICKSRVNGSSVPRPEKLKPDEKWEIEYLLQEWDNSQTMWARYEDMKARRKSIFEQHRKDKEDEDDKKEGDVDKKKRGGYIEFLQSISKEGRVFRDRMDELDAGKVPVVVGQPIYESEQSVGDKIEGLEDYLGWLYGAGAPDPQER